MIPSGGLIYVDKYHYYDISEHKLDIKVAKQWRGKTNLCEWELHKSWVGDYYLILSPLSSDSFWKCARSIVHKWFVSPAAKNIIKKIRSALLETRAYSLLAFSCLDILSIYFRYITSGGHGYYC